MVTLDNREVPENSMPRPIFIVHGYNVRDGGAGSVDKIGSYVLRRHGQVRQFDYGYTGIMDILRHNKKYAQDLANAVRQTHCHEGLAIGHSNGCAVICEAARRGAKWERVLLINPALPVGYKFHDNLGEVLVIHTKHDLPTRAAAWGNRVPFLRWFVPNAWGQAGAKGCLHAHYNFNMSDFIYGHSELFTDDNLQEWGDFFVDQLSEKYSYYHREGSFHNHARTVLILREAQQATVKITYPEDMDTATTVAEGDSNE